ncbi:MAG TPA: hypothetical protein VGN96_18925 [Roseococcus sp.]|jgi:hypothetical protein|nr:hypothetical protein [Roseococcus sp.]
MFGRPAAARAAMDPLPREGVSVGAAITMEGRGVAGASAAGSEAGRLVSGAVLDALDLVTGRDDTLLWDSGGLGGGGAGAFETGAEASFAGFARGGGSFAAGAGVVLAAVLADADFADADFMGAGFTGAASAVAAFGAEAAVAFLPREGVAMAFAAPAVRRMSQRDHPAPYARNSPSGASDPGIRRPILSTYGGVAQKWGVVTRAADGAAHGTTDGVVQAAWA